jgi:outer membrane biosynthesis protein TonB
MAKKLVILMMLAPLSAACASLGAEKPVENPALSVPAPPEKTVEPTPVEPQIPEPVPELPPPPVAPPRPRPQTREPNNNANRETPKPPDPKPAEATAPPVDTTPAAPAVPPLRTPDAIGPEQNARQIRDVMGRTNGMLSRIDYMKLTNEQKKAYDDAKQFLDQAESGLKEANFDFARNVAEKAEKLAKALQGR